LPGAGVTFFIDAGGGQQAGPYTVQQIAGGVTNGQVLPTTLAWSNGMAAWAPASTIPALAGLFNQPPPMPGAPPPMPPTPPPPAAPPSAPA
jgi:hypothetical protein